jgi:hypothetical protein
MMMKNLTARQYAEWVAFDQLDPVGEWRADFRHASLLSFLFNMAQSVWGGEKKRRSAPRDFFPEWGKEPPPKESEKKKAGRFKHMFQTLARVMGKDKK